MADKSVSSWSLRGSSILSPMALGSVVILVGHDFGGVCVSYAMELFPFRISKAVFVAAAMLISGQSALDMFSQKSEPDFDLDIKEDVQEECSKYGTLKHIFVDNRCGTAAAFAQEIHRFFGDRSSVINY